MKTKLILGIALAMSVVLMVGCGGKQQASTSRGMSTVADETGAVEVRSIESELLRDCQINHRRDNFCGIGQGSSTTESMAKSIAMNRAREELVQSIRSVIDASIDDATAQNENLRPYDAAARAAGTRAVEQVRNINTEEMRTTFNRETRVFTVYVLVTASRNEVLGLVERNMRQSETMNEIEHTGNMLSHIREMLAR